MDRTEGIMTLPDGTEIAVLERPWLDNKVGVSCIPEGNYIVNRDRTGKHRWFAIPDAPGRTLIEIHPANKTSQLAGCLAPCSHIEDGFAHDSVEACELLLQWYGDDSWTLEITS